MAVKSKTTSDQMWSKLNSWEYDYDTATYLLLLSRKRRGLPLKLSSSSSLKNCDTDSKMVNN